MKCLIPAVALAACVAVAAPAQATVLTATITGVIQANSHDPIDTKGLFGGGSMIGDTATYQVSIDVANSQAPNVTGIPGNYLIPQSASAESATVTINGYSQSLTSVSSSVMTATNSGYSVEVVDNGASPVERLSLLLVGGTNSLVLDNESDFLAFLNNELTASNSNYSYISLQYTDGSYTNVYILPTGVSGPDLPEPATLGLFGAALAGLAAVRRRGATR
jgi:PEP-CTERM motif